jgi:hypothetical protein
MRCPRLSNIQLSRSGDLASWPELLSIAGWYARRCPRTRAAVETRSSCLPYGRVVLIVSRRYSCRTDAVHSAPCHASTGTPHTPNAQLRTQRTELSALGPVRGAHAERDQPLLHQARHAPTADTACQLSSLGCSCDRNSRVLRSSPSTVSTISAQMPGTALTSIAAACSPLCSVHTRCGLRPSRSVRACTTRAHQAASCITAFVVSRTRARPAAPAPRVTRARCATQS